jgi:type II secretory pathway pseudopilin PulG
MSNVLIGIIGVILFIGLALAGALFLGPRFQESTNNSRASASVQAVSQIANAINMYNVQEGKTVTNTDATKGLVAAETPYVELVGGNYLKSVPSNPTGTGLTNIITSGNTKAVTMVLGTNGLAVCNAINKQTMGSEPAAGVAVGAGTAGCSIAGTVYTAWATA